MDDLELFSDPQSHANLQMRMAAALATDELRTFDREWLAERARKAMHIRS